MNEITFIIDDNNKIIINKKNGIETLIGSKAHKYYFAFLAEARKIYKTNEEQQNVVLYALMQHGFQNWKVA